jgi:hypothetical protein
MTEAPKSVRPVLALALAAAALGVPACANPVKTEPSKEAQLAML